jgi:hypothetical protein
MGFEPTISALTGRCVRPLHYGARTWGVQSAILAVISLACQGGLLLISFQYELYGGREMGKRDYRHRESKKPKKDAKKTPVGTIIQPPATVEVIKKGKKEKEKE